MLLTHGQRQMAVMEFDMDAIGKLTLRNYRCFDWDNPVTLEFGDGFTAIVGPNNSGKSTALRALYELRSILPHCLGCCMAQNNYQVTVDPHGVTDVTEIANDEDPTKFEIQIEIFSFPEPSGGAELAIGMTLEYDVLKRQLTAKKVRTVNQENALTTWEWQELRNVGNSQNGSFISYQNGKSIEYLTLQYFANELCQAKFFPAFRNAINSGAGSYYDLPVGTALVNTWDEWKAGNTRAQKLAISKVEQEIAELLGFKSLQINADKSGGSLDVIINGRPKKLYEVGAGTAQLIITLAAALVYKPTYILIDEPELSLHPALQISFLSTLASYASHGLLFATHSIGLARTTAKRIYSIKKIRDSCSTMRVFGDDKINFGQWLGELSYSNRLELGCEGILLVEGPSEILCFQEFLRRLGKDQKFVLMSLGGSSLIRAGVANHMAELTRIVDPSKIHVFIDSERSVAGEALAADRAAFVSECSSIGITVNVSDRKATENYFEVHGIHAALGNQYSPLSPFELLKKAAKPWHKSENWKISRATNFDDIKDTDLGKFLLSL